MPPQERQTRPIYMLIFNDYLKRHNEEQPKYQPKYVKVANIQRARAAAVTAKALKEANIVVPTAAAAAAANSKSNTETSVPSQVSSNNTLRTQTKTAATSSSSQPSSTTQPASVVSRTSYVGSAVQSTAANPQSVSRSPTVTITGAGPGAGASDAGGSGATWTFNLASNPRIAAAYANHRTSTDFNKTNSMVAKGGRVPWMATRPGGAPTTHRASPINRAHGAMKDSAPSVSQTPAANLGNSSGAAILLGLQPQQQPATASSQLTRMTTISKSPYVSMAKTIAEQTPNAFKTLGPGFNSAAEKSVSLKPGNGPGGSGGGTLASQNMPSDYEHIFHAPSQISDLPSVNTHDRLKEKLTLVGEKRSSSSKKRHHHRHRHSRDGGGGGGGTS